VRLGDLLLDQGAIDREQLDAALREQRRAGGRLGEHLVRRQAITHAALHYHLGLQRSRRVEEQRSFGRMRLVADLARDFVRLSPRSAAASVALIFAGTALSMTFPYFVKLVFDHGGADVDGTLRLGALAVSFQLMAQLALYLGNQIFNAANVRLSTDVRRRLHRTLHALHFTAFAQRTAGQWITHLTSDVDNVIERWERLYLVFFRNVFAISISAVVLAVIDPLITALVLVLSAAMVLVPGWISNMANPALMRRPHLVAGIIDLFRERLRGFRVQKSLGAEPQALAEIGRRFDDHYRNDFQMVRFWNVAFNLRMVMGALLTGVILFVGGHRVVEGRYGASDLMLVVVTVNMLAPYVDELMQVIISTNDVKRYWQRCAEILSVNVATAADRARAERAGAPPRLDSARAGEVAIEQLAFAYGGRPVFDRLSMELGGRRCYAVIGRSGAGKSTLLRLLLRELTPDAGRILVDGRPIAEMSERDVCERIAYVAQRPAIFQDSVANNIRFGAMAFMDDVPPAAIERAARRAGIHERIVALPRGYDTIIGDGGHPLSGGERARVAVARALVKSPSICLFDEPTASLDPQNQRQVMDALLGLRGHCTVIVSTHDTSLLAHVDDVLVIDERRARVVPPAALRRGDLLELLGGRAAAAREAAAG